MGMGLEVCGLQKDDPLRTEDGNGMRYVMDDR